MKFESSYRELPDHFYSEVSPAKVPEPSLIRLNESLASDLGFDLEFLRSKEGVAMLAGNAVPDGAFPISQVYAGHQFGGWVPRLGDGRAILLGEMLAKDGRRYDVQWKGSGRTPYSRGGDGKSPLGPVLREYLVSEFMHALGVPTTRALAAVATGERVFREESLPGAVFTRVASSHIRVGTFQYFLGQQDEAGLRKLADYVIARHYPGAAGSESPYAELLRGVLNNQASLIAHWMSFGFIHGVMNTDNMTVSGETIDFGPCAFLDTFHSEKVFSSIDRNGRYAWGNQPTIALWNLTRLAEALLPLLHKDKEKAVEIAQAVLDEFEEKFQSLYFERFLRKLGLSEDTPENRDFFSNTLQMMSEEKLDFTLFFRRLTQVAGGGDPQLFLSLFGEKKIGEAWLEDWKERGGETGSEMMKSVNPVFIARNHRIEEAIVAANAGDFSPFNRLAEAFVDPFSEKAEFSDLENPPAASEEVTETFCGT